MEKWNSQLEHRQPMERNKRLHVRLRCGSLSITTPVSLLVNEFDVQAYCTDKWAWQLSIKFV